MTGQVRCAPFVKAGLCPLPAQPPLPNGISRCNNDEDCDDAKKCCPTLIGRRCLLPDPLRIICPDSSLADLTCVLDIDCLDANVCINDVCCPEIPLPPIPPLPPVSPLPPLPKPGFCPPLTIPAGWEKKDKDLCDIDDDCPLARKCCITLLGNRCLLPIA
ncbi:WAP domain containing protein, SLPI-like [Trichuris trichiura]|uniref:WAP domain containing protein, SLPI-like n=1 Tax=Trichuris trichiura TaxID=36087 RepID=A0A077ZLR3_TRITR|nr:WAP domain containing protein, SLPI-like [Trichuris trichiura]